MGRFQKTITQTGNDRNWRPAAVVTDVPQFLHFHQKRSAVIEWGELTAITRLRLPAGGWPVLYDNLAIQMPGRVPEKRKDDDQPDQKRRHRQSQGRGDDNAPCQNRPRVRLHGSHGGNDRRGN